MNSFTFDGVSSETYNVIVSGTQTFASPVRDVEFLEIPGRSGALLLDKEKWSDVEVRYPCLILDTFRTDFPAFRAWLMSKIGKFELSDTYDTDHYRIGTFIGPLTPETSIRMTSARFDVGFKCQPQRYLNSGKRSVSMVSGNVINNPTLYPSKPRFTVALAGGSSGSLTINGQTLTITDCPLAYITIDCERQDAYYQHQNLNPYVTLTTGEFPELASGDNTLTFTGGITRVTVVPRWWTL